MERAGSTQLHPTCDGVSEQGSYVVYESLRILAAYDPQTLAQIYLYDSYRADDKFQRDYWNKMGREPYANPMVRFKWLERILLCTFGVTKGV